MDRQAHILTAMGGQTGSIPGSTGLGEGSEGQVEFVCSILSPPGLRPEHVLVQMTERETGYSVCGRPGGELLILLADMKRAGCEESHIIDALNQRLQVANAEHAPTDVPSLGLASRPEFAESMQRINAARDPDGVPVTARDAVIDWILRFSELILDHPFSPILPDCLQMMATELET